jgi:valyl-tRNA synthetase
MGLVMEIIRAIRNVRAEFKLDPTFQLSATVEAAEDFDLIEAESQAIGALTRTIIAPPSQFEDGARAENVIKIVVGRVIVALHLGGSVNGEAERKRLQLEMADTERYTQSLAARLGNEQFTSKAPADVVERERARLEEQHGRIASLRELLRQLEA